MSARESRASAAPPRTVGRLSLYRRLLGELLAEGTTSLCSRELAEAAGVTASLVRRDLMVVDYTGSPRHGYDAGDLLMSIDEYLDPPEAQAVALVGVGNLGRALLMHFAGRTPKLPLRAVFDNAPSKVGRVVAGYEVHGVNELPKVVRGEGIGIAMIAVPASAAQAVAELCTKAGVRGILNFAPVQLTVPPHVYVTDIDLAIALDRAAFFARHAPCRPRHKGGPGRERLPEAGKAPRREATDGSGARRSAGSQGLSESAGERALRRRFRLAAR